MPLVVGVLELIGYREWTESLGFDREWRIQVIQSSLYAALQETVARYGGFVAPMSYDVMIVVGNGIGLEGFRKLYSVAEKRAPVPVSLTVMLLEGDVAPSGRPGLHLNVDDTRYPVAAVHVDLNGFTGRRMRMGVVAAYSNIVSVYGDAVSSMQGSIPVYLGGDNMVFFMGEEELDRIKEFLERVVAEEFKVGVGVGPNARTALEAAAEALHILRASGGGIHVVRRV